MVWGFSRYSSYCPHYKNKHTQLIEDSALFIGVGGSVNTVNALEVNADQSRMDSHLLMKVCCNRFQLISAPHEDKC